MPIQTARVTIRKTAVGEYHLEVITPDGEVGIPIPPEIRGLEGHQSFCSYIRNPEAPTIKKVSKKRQKRDSIAQENEVMELLGGRRQAGSGAVAHLKGDGRVRGKYRVEMKYTRAGSYRVERTELSKIRGECAELEQPLFVVDFQSPKTGALEDRWVLVPFETFLKLDPTSPAL